MDNYETEDQTDFWFPKNNPSIKKLGLYSSKKQLLAMELGVIMLEKGTNEAKRIINGEKNNEIEQIHEEYSKQEQKYKSIIRDKTEELNRKARDYNDSIDQIRRDVKIELETLYLERIESLQEREHKAQERIGELIGENNGHHEKFFNKYESLRNELERKNETLQAKCENLQQELKEHMSLKNNSAKKGQEGENWIYNELLRLFPRAEIEDKHKESHKGDFYIKDSNKICMIDVKIYNKNVPKKEIVKFYNDVEKNDEIDTAILISLTTGIANHKDFSLEFRTGKPILFLHKVINSPQNIKAAYNIIQLILKHKDCFDITNEETQKKIKLLVDTMKRRNTRLQNTLNNFHTNMKDELEGQWNDFKEAISILNLDN